MNKTKVNKLLTAAGLSGECTKTKTVGFYGESRKCVIVKNARTKDAQAIKALIAKPGEVLCTCYNEQGFSIG